MSTLKLEHIAHIDNAGPDISIDSSGHLNIVNGNLQMGGVTMLDASNGDLSTGNNASVNIRDAAGEVAGRIRNWSSPTNSIAIESDPSNSAAGSYLTFTVDGAQKMTILGNNVGIGTTDPKSTLDTGYTRIYNSGAASSPSAGKGLEVHYVTSGRTQGEGAYLISYDRDNSAYKQLVVDANNIELSTGGNNRLTILSGGNVGIGTTNPSQILEAQTSSTTYVTATTTGTGTSAGHRSTAGTNDWVWFATQGQPNYRLYDYASSAVRLTVTNSGNVGIGTESPTSKLHTDGAIVSTNLAQGTGELQIQGYGSTGYINMNGSGSLIFRMGSSYSQDLKLTSAGILQGSSDAEIKTSPIRKHSNTISTNTTIDSSENAIASGPISVATGVTLTINGNMTVV